MNKLMLAQRLKAMRIQEGLSQYELAKTLHVSRSCVNNWELGETTPNAEMLVTLALYFHVTLDYLLGLDERHDIQVATLSSRLVGEINNLIRAIEDERLAAPSKP